MLLIKFIRNRGWKFRVTSLLTLKIVECLGTDVATKISQIHAATGRDKTCILHVFSKTKVSQWKRKSEASKHNCCFMQSFRHYS